MVTTGIREVLAGRRHPLGALLTGVKADAAEEPMTGDRQAVPFDVLLVPGGSAAVDARLLGETGRKAVRDFVWHGGGYCGVCAGAFLALRYTSAEESLALVDASASMHDGRPRCSLQEEVPDGLATHNREGTPCQRNEQWVGVRLTAEGRHWLWDEGRSEAKEPLETKGTVRMRYSNGPLMVPTPGSRAKVLGTSWPVAHARHSVHPMQRVMPPCWRKISVKARWCCCPRTRSPPTSHREEAARSRAGRA